MSQSVLDSNGGIGRTLMTSGSIGSIRSWADTNIPAGDVAIVVPDAAARAQAVGLFREARIDVLVMSPDDLAALSGTASRRAFYDSLGAAS